MKIKLIFSFAACTLVTSVCFAQSVIAPAIVTQPADQTENYGSNATLSVQATGQPLNYQWQKDGQPLADYHNVAGANNSTLKLIGVAQSDAGSYNVIISNSAGSVTSSNAVLTVNSKFIFHDDFENGLTN